MPAESFRKGGAKKGAVCALNRGNSNDMDSCDFEGNSFNLRPRSMYATRILYFPSKGLKEMTLGLVDNYRGPKAKESFCQLKHYKRWILNLALLGAHNW